MYTCEQDKGVQFEEVLKKNIDYSTREKGVLVYKLQSDFKAGLRVQIRIS